jgi:hypothetical protein
MSGYPFEDSYGYACARRCWPALTRWSSETAEFRYWHEVANPDVRYPVSNWQG